ncbi:MAG: HD domain-containing protein [Candidatus Yanofskybacteria bacterium]|nr:HD domain-containing protein [Candidatus Yanofskybacteria bacterium]
MEFAHKEALEFIDLTHKLQQIRRKILVKNEHRFENDLEHQYQLAMLAWYLINSQKLKLDTNKAIRYALIHDIVEVYAGDTFFYGKQNGKKQREQKAARLLRKNFHKFKDLHRLIKNYESQSDKESKFVYALDKLIPIYNIYLDKGRTWRKFRITLQMLEEKKRDKVSVSIPTKHLFEEMLKDLKKNKKLFN